MLLVELQNSVTFAYTKFCEEQAMALKKLATDVNKISSNVVGVGYWREPADGSAADGFRGVLFKLDPSISEKIFENLKTMAKEKWQHQKGNLRSFPENDEELLSTILSLNGSLCDGVIPIKYTHDGKGTIDSICIYYVYSEPVQKILNMLGLTKEFVNGLAMHFDKPYIYPANITIYNCDKKEEKSNEN